MCRSLAILLLLTGAASATEVTRSRVYESRYQPATIVALIIDGAIDVYRSGGIGGGGLAIDWNSATFIRSVDPWRIEYSYRLSIDGIYVTKRTIATADRIWQAAYVTGDIGELTSAYFVSDARQHSRGTTIVNSLTVEWYPKARCRAIRRFVSRVAERRVIPPLVDNGLRQIESGVVNVAHGGVLWPVLETLRGGLR